MSDRVKTLVKETLSGNRLALSRLISKVENRDKDLKEIISLVYKKTGHAKVIGITGPPGAGKSTLVDQLTREIRKKKQTVAIVAVDPSSPFSGGAILGDRIRMQDHAKDDGVYIRSLGTRGHHGGLSQATREIIHLFDAAGFDWILVETAGVGQTELSIIQVAHTVLVVLVPESGDSIQVMKAGLMEIADLFAVNKSDRPAADLLVKELITMVQMGHPEKDEWAAPVLKTEAVHGKGMKELITALEKHQDYLKKSTRSAKRLAEHAISELESILTETVRAKLLSKLNTSSGKALLKKLVQKQSDPYSVLNKII